MAKVLITGKILWRLMYDHVPLHQRWKCTEGGFMGIRDMRDDWESAVLRAKVWLNDRGAKEVTLRTADGRMYAVTRDADPSLHELLVSDKGMMRRRAEYRTLLELCEIEQRNEAIRAQDRDLGAQG